jgi:hypothetical protein
MDSPHLAPDYRAGEGMIVSAVRDKIYDRLGSL